MEYLATERHRRRRREMRLDGRQSFQFTIRVRFRDSAAVWRQQRSFTLTLARVVAAATSCGWLRRRACVRASGNSLSHRPRRPRSARVRWSIDFRRCRGDGGPNVSRSRRHRRRRPKRRSAAHIVGNGSRLWSEGVGGFIDGAWVSKTPGRRRLRWTSKREINVRKTQVRDVLERRTARSARYGEGCDHTHAAVAWIGGSAVVALFDDCCVGRVIALAIRLIRAHQFVSFRLAANRWTRRSIIAERSGGVSR